MAVASYGDESHVFTLEDLGRWEFDGVALAVIGSPVKHSLSPQMHNRALAEMAQQDPQFARWRYFRFEVPPERLRDGLLQFHAAGFMGLNLTIPHKVEAVSYVASVEPVARDLGAVNTLKRQGEGFHGHNTDGYGIAQAVREELGRDLAGADVVLLGAGGAARAIAVQALHSGCRSIWIGNRSQGRLDELLRTLAPLDAQNRVHAFTLPGLPSAPLQAPIVINATSLGLSPQDSPPVDVGALPAGSTIYDTTYGLSTNQLAEGAQSRGIPYANGLSMLVWQGVRALEIWTEREVPVGAMREGAMGALRKRHA